MDYGNPSGTVYGPFDDHIEAMDVMLEIAYCIDDSSKKYYRTTIKQNGDWVVDYGSHTRFIVIRDIQ